MSEAWICGSGSGSTPKCHGSATLILVTVCVTLCSVLVGDLKRLNLSEGEYESLEAMESAKARATISMVYDHRLVYMQTKVPPLEYS